MEGLKYPFVVGGDGATAVIPRSKVEAAQKEILAVARRLSDAGEIMLGGGGGDEFL